MDQTTETLKNESAEVKQGPAGIPPETSTFLEETPEIRAARGRVDIADIHRVHDMVGVMVTQTPAEREENEQFRAVVERVIRLNVDTPKPLSPEASRQLVETRANDLRRFIREIGLNKQKKVAAEAEYGRNGSPESSAAIDAVDDRLDGLDKEVHRLTKWFDGLSKPLEVSPEDSSQVTISAGETGANVVSDEKVEEGLAAVRDALDDHTPPQNAPIGERSAPSNDQLADWIQGENWRRGNDARNLVPPYKPAQTPAVPPTSMRGDTDSLEGAKNIDGLAFDPWTKAINVHPNSGEGPANDQTTLPEAYADVPIGENGNQNGANSVTRSDSDTNASSTVVAPDAQNDASSISSIDENGLGHGNEDEDKDENKKRGFLGGLFNRNGNKKPLPVPPPVNNHPVLRGAAAAAALGLVADAAIMPPSHDIPMSRPGAVAEDPQFGKQYESQVQRIDGAVTEHAAPVASTETPEQLFRDENTATHSAPEHAQGERNEEPKVTTPEGVKVDDEVLTEEGKSITADYVPTGMPPWAGEIFQDRFIQVGMDPDLALEAGMVVNDALVHISKANPAFADVIGPTRKDKNVPVLQAIMSTAPELIPIINNLPKAKTSEEIQQARAQMEAIFAHLPKG